MIVLHAPDGRPYALNCDLVERVDTDPTTFTLVGGTTHVALDDLDDVIARVLEFRAAVVALANRVEGTAPPRRRLRAVVAPQGDD